MGDSLRTEEASQRKRLQIVHNSRVDKRKYTRYTRDKLKREQGQRKQTEVKKGKNNEER